MSGLNSFCGPSWSTSPASDINYYDVILFSRMHYSANGCFIKVLEQIIM